ncbi:MAG: hypothetical protein HRT69_00610 [Flavobacteriaceae bacterium]|nr:hypothetical protein [Flavobacteriaceae bacterium]
MKKIVSLLFFVSSMLSAQVGINTTAPSPASVLHLEALNNLGVYGGFMPPKVTLAERELIPVTVSDDGMMVFLSDGLVRCVQIYDAVNNVWVDFYCMPITLPVIFSQDFDSNTSWTFTSDVAFFQNGSDGYYDISNGAEFPSLLLNNNFFGILDLNDEGDNGTTGEATLLFGQVDVSGIANAIFSFEYDSHEFNNVADYFKYELFHDGVGQGKIVLCEGCNNDSDGVISVGIPDSVTNFHVEIIVQCNGVNDYVGFDNFKIY